MCSDDAVATNNTSVFGLLTRELIPHAFTRQNANIHPRFIEHVQANEIEHAVSEKFFSQLQQLKGRLVDSSRTRIPIFMICDLTLDL